MKLQPGSLVKIGVSLIVLTVVIATVGAQNLLEALRGVDLRWFALALAIHLIGVGVRAYRWWLLIASLGAPVSFGRLVYLYFVGAFFNTFLPTGIGGDLVKIVELSSERGGAKAFSTVFADRLTGILGSSLIALAVAWIDPADVPQDIRTLVVVVSASILLTTALLTQGRLIDQLLWRSRFFANLPFAGRLHKVYVAMTSYSIGAIARSTLVSFPFTATLIATQYVLAIALGLRVDVRYFILFTPIVALALVLPALNGLGIREGAYSVLFGPVGVAGPDAVAMSLLYQVVRVLTGLLGGAIYIVGNLRGRTATRSVEESASRQAAYAGQAMREPIERFYYGLKARLLRLAVMPRDADVYIISYPKSGRTWLRVLLGKALCLKFGLPDEMMLDTYRLTAAAGILRAHFIHDFSEILTGFPYHRLPTAKTEFARKKVVLIVRDIKDVLVSSYFQATRRTNKYQGSISDFIRSEKFGVRKVAAFYNTWHSNRHVPEEFLLLRYEEMHQNPADALARTLRVIGVEEIESDILKQAVDFARFENMKKMEAEGYFKDPKMQPANARDEESFKVRKGIVGGYAAYLSEADIQYIDRVVEEMGCPFIEMQPV